MKYKCSDGVDRDEALEQYASLCAKIRTLKAQIADKHYELKLLENEASKIRFDQLGMIGLNAYDKYFKP
jgi:hypothetical protein